MIRAMTARLSAMMFLEFFIWGAWYVTIGNYMIAHGMSDLTHWPYTVNPIAAIIAPFFLGLIADRFFPTEKVLGTLHLIGGVLMFFVPALTGNPTLFILLLLAYNICYMPTMALANSLAFSHIEDQEKQFPKIRVFGTIGWIVAGLFIASVLGLFVGDQVPDETAWPLYTTAIASIALGLYSFTLPHTPPPAKGEKVSLRSIVGIDALKALGSKSFYVFIAASMLISIPLAAYYNFAPIFVNGSLYAGGTEAATGLAGWILNDVFTSPAGLMSLGQMSEVIFMLLMPFFFVRLGVKWMLAAGMAAWVIRFVLFALGAPASVFWMIALGVILHGICYDFFFVTGQIYVDKKATPGIRAQAQGFIVLVTYGVGLGIGAQIIGALNNALRAGAEVMSPELWKTFWMYPAGFALAVLIFFVLMFDDRVLPEDEDAEMTAADVLGG
ncbi:MAG: MFS transporter [Rhodothermales bacterium]